MKLAKKIVILLAPLLLFAILFFPYKSINQHFIVDWLGCGCPEIIVTSDGNLIEEDSFNANDFTTLFWLFISVCVAVISVFLSKLIPKEKFWFRILYIVGMLLISLLIAYRFRQMMMWC